VAKTSQDLARGAYISRHDAATQGFPLMWDRRAILQATAAVALAAVDLAALAAALALAVIVRVKVLPAAAPVFPPEHVCQAHLRPGGGDNYPAFFPAPHGRHYRGH